MAIVTDASTVWLGTVDFMGYTLTVIAETEAEAAESLRGSMDARVEDGDTKWVHYKGGSRQFLEENGSLLEVEFNEVHWL